MQTSPDQEVESSEDDHDEQERPVPSFPEFIKSCAPINEPLPLRFQQARRSSSVYTKCVPEPPSHVLAPSNHGDSGSQKHLPIGTSGKPIRSQPALSRTLSPDEEQVQVTDGTETISASTCLMPGPRRRYPHGLASPDISPLMIPTLGSRRVSESSQGGLPPPEAYLDSMYTPPPDTFYSEEVITEAFNQPLFAEQVVDSSPHAISSVGSQQLNPLLFSRESKAHEALGITPARSDYSKPDERTPRHSFSRFRAALRAVSQDESESNMAAFSRRSIPSTSSSSTRATVHKPSAAGMKELLTDDYHRSISEQARSDREASVSSAIAKEQMKLIPAPLYLKDGTVRQVIKDDGTASSKRDHSSGRDTSSTSLSGAGPHQQDKHSSAMRTSSSTSSPVMSADLPRNPASSVPSTTTNPSAMVSPITPTLTRKDAPTPTRSLSAPRRLFVNAAPNLFRSTSKKLLKSPELRAEKTQRRRPQKSKSDDKLANDLWRQEIIRTIKVVGEVDPNAIGMSDREDKLPKRPFQRRTETDKDKAKVSTEATSDAVRDHLGWDRSRFKTKK